MELRQALDRFLQNLSVENCTEEVQRALSSDWLNKAAPGASRLIGCSQGIKKHLEGDVAAHTGLVMMNLFLLCKERENREPSRIELIAVLLHDLRKPECQLSDGSGGMSFPGHEAMAANEISTIGQRLELKANEIEGVEFLIRHHGTIHGWEKLSEDQRQMLRGNSHFNSLKLLLRADMKSCILPGGKTPEFPPSL